MNPTGYDYNKEHTIHRHQQHLSWDNARPPAITIAPGDCVEFKDLDAMGGQITAQSTLGELPTLDPDLINLIAGPVYVDGAEPGDTLKVTLLGFETCGRGWTAVFPEFGLLVEDFPDFSLHIWSYDRSFGAPAAYGRWARVPLKPFCGTVGVARAQSGTFGTLPPYDTGGNMDIRDLSRAGPSAVIWTKKAMT